MFSTIVNKLAAGTRDYRNTLDQVAEFSALKTEISKARAIIELSAKGDISHVNDNLCASLGYSAKELLGQHHRTLLAREEAAKPDYEQFWNALQGGKSQVGSFKLINKEGAETWFQGYYAPVMQGAQLRKVVAYLTDITADKKRNLTLQEEENALNQSFGVMECDLQGHILTCNEVFLKPLGYQHSEVVGKHISMFLKENTAQSAEYKQLWQKLSKGENAKLEICRVAKNGSEFWFSTSYVPIMGADGTVSKVKVYSYCITEEKQKQLNFQGQVAAINLSQAVTEFDIHGNVLAANQNFLALTGYTLDEVLGKHHSMFVSARYKASQEYKDFWAKLSRGEADVGVYHRYGKQGKDIYLQASYNPILGLDGKPVKVVKFATDITPAVLADQAQKAKAREATMIKNALDASSNSLMMADKDGFITYMNPAALDLMRESSKTFKQLFPHFDAEKLIGQNYDVFHKNPSHQRNLLGGLTGKHQTEIGVGDMFFRLTANPIFESDGERLGTVIEWVDQTQEKRVENQISQALKLAVEGDVTFRLDTSIAKGTAVETMNSINQLLDIMNDILVNVREAGETINTAAHEISSGNNDLSSRTEQQASNLEETASSMEQLASTVKQNAENARQANQMAEAASQVAIRGGEVVGNVVTTMSAINESARKIEDIISVIDGIAFQTNILALNAAVEAARAGEQGRGFAVVAGEVRNLAQRSASAAKEIKELITDSVNKTADGTKLVETAGETMHEVVTSVQRVTDIMSEITAASAEQSSGINQVNDAVNHMDEVTQQNAALVEEAAAAAESLVEQASNLMDTVNRFKVSGGPTQAKRAAPARVAVASRPAAPVSKPKPAAAQSHANSYQPAKSAKTGTDDTEWEEF
ncbi:methyl-accepting chemotaxis protein [Methylophilus sp.]|jgi:methyl-accepting chemotaxis protein|uniref:methyl-accepting chemotaxis protein n=1 Tax=Methylophilus sp. TaxID=29541 RepID=UPI0011D37979|nr:methyl-accepting chemotaxis protein [Methylophilus sp.]TXI47689.1 MAG: methyl-accepting chemotaxis protein [Methylophilus sp.]